MTTRRTASAGLAAAAASLLSSCGTIIYPDRVHQKERGNLDPAVVILDAVGLFFFIIPGIVAFAVDFGTGAIYLPAGHEPGDHERTIFDKVETSGKPHRQHIECIVGNYIGVPIDLNSESVLAIRLNHIGELDGAYRQLAV